MLTQGRDGLFRAFGWLAAVAMAYQSWQALRTALAEAWYGTALESVVAPVVWFGSLGLGLGLGLVLHGLPDWLGGARLAGRVASAPVRETLSLGAAWALLLLPLVGYATLGDAAPVLPGHLPFSPESFSRWLLADLAATTAYGLLRVWLLGRVPPGFTVAWPKRGWPTLAKIPEPPTPPAVWLVFDRPVSKADGRFIDRLAAQRDDAPFVLVAQAGGELLGEHLWLADRQGRLKALFPQLEIELSDWLRLLPPPEHWQALPCREIYPSAGVLPAAVRSLRGVEDRVLLMDGEGVGRWRGVLPLDKTQVLVPVSGSGGISKSIAGYQTTPITTEDKSPIKEPLIKSKKRQELMISMAEMNGGLAVIVPAIFYGFMLPGHVDWTGICSVVDDDHQIRDCRIGFHVWTGPSHYPISSVEPQRLSMVIAETSKDKSLIIGIDSDKYRIGDTLQMQISVAKPLFVNVLKWSSSGSYEFVFPAQKSANNPKPIDPGAIADGKILLKGPAGAEQLIAIALERPIPNDIVPIDENGKLTKLALEQAPIVVRLNYKLNPGLPSLDCSQQTSLESFKESVDGLWPGVKANEVDVVAAWENTLHKLAGILEQTKPSEVARNDKVRALGCLVVMGDAKDKQARKLLDEFKSTYARYRSTNVFADWLIAMRDHPGSPPPKGYAVWWENGYALAKMGDKTAAEDQADLPSPLSETERQAALEAKRKAEAEARRHNGFKPIPLPPASLPKE